MGLPPTVWEVFGPFRLITLVELSVFRSDCKKTLKKQSLMVLMLESTQFLLSLFSIVCLGDDRRTH